MNYTRVSHGDHEDYGVQGLHGTVAPQKAEDFYDDRSDADDDLEKGRLKFPHRMYGRGKELGTLRETYGKIASAADGEGAPASATVFLSGYSGVGKSSLVKEFVRQIQRDHRSSNDSSILYASGKYTQQNTASAPFSAIIEVLGRLAVILGTVDFCDPRSKVSTKTRGSQLIGPGTEGNRILRATFPVLEPLLDSFEGGAQKLDGLGVEGRSNVSAHPSMNAIKESSHELLCAISEAMEQPVVLFLDDMQWADEASMEMLSFLLASSRLGHIMFICAYRSNEVDADHLFTKLMENVTYARDGSGRAVERMELFSLPPEAIKKFIADSVKKDEAEDVAELAEVVYTKTMGNIFFVMQALEELVRKNALFYDIMSFEWRWVVSRVELANFMSDDVVETVKGKIRELPVDVQDLLVVMSYLPNFNSPYVSILAELMSNDERTFKGDAIDDTLKEASEEGMLIYSGESRSYIFGHDRIRQASLEFAAERENREELVLHISRVFMKFTHSLDMEWCFFVAVDLLNSLPPSKVEREILIRLNIKVSKIARFRGAIEKENDLLYKALTCLNSSGFMWKGKYYGLTLEVYNAAIKSDFSLGHYDKAGVTISNVLRNATSNNDKVHAYLHQIMCKCDETSDYTQGAVDGVDILNRYGFDIPATLSKPYMMKEELKLKLALGHRSYLCLAELPLKEDDSLFHFLMLAQRCAMLSANQKLAKLLAWKSMQCATKRGGMDRNLPTIIGYLAVTLAREENVETSQQLGHVALTLAEKIRGDTEVYVSIRGLVIGCVLCQLESFMSSVEPLLQAHRDMRLVGTKVEAILGSMLGYSESFFAAGLQLGPLLESKLHDIEEYCRNVGRSGFLMSFQISRQFALNLRKRTEHPTEFRGEVFWEEEFLEKIDGNARKMALRDSSSKRLMLAFVFWHEDTMRQMLTILSEYPLRDSLVPRLHNRLCFMGLASFALDEKNRSVSLSKLGRDCLKYFSNLVKHGSVNAKPVHLFMLAMKDPNRDAFSTAINACSEASMVHLEAMANERYAAFLTSENDLESAQEVISTSYWQYQEWGAYAKAFQLFQQHDFLKSHRRRSPDTLTWNMSEV